MSDPQLKRLNINDNGEATLTDQEISVMKLVAEGKANAVIALKTFTSEKTVARMLTHTSSKYGLVGRSKTV